MIYTFPQSAYYWHKFWGPMRRTCAVLFDADDEDGAQSWSEGAVGRPYCESECGEGYGTGVQFIHTTKLINPLHFGLS